MKNLEERLLDEYFGIDTDLRRQAEARLAAREPLAYILGDTVFFAEKYSVSPAVLIPRPDTERVVEWALKLLPEPGVPKIRPFGFFRSFLSTMMRLLLRALMPQYSASLPV